MLYHAISIYDSSATAPIALLVGIGVKSHLSSCSVLDAVTCLHELLELHLQCVNDKENLKDEVQKLRVDVRTADKALERMKGQHQLKEQEVGSLTIKVHTLPAYFNAFC